jgi:lipoprotein LprG
MHRADGAPAGRHRLPTSALALFLAPLALLVASCSGGADESSPAHRLLIDTKKQVDSASSAHFHLASENVPSGSSAVLGGDGDMARPGKFAGQLKVAVAGGSATVSIVSVGGKVYAKLPFATTYAVADPSRFGFGDPGAFMDPGSGLSTLLTKAHDARSTGRHRVEGEVVQEVTATLPGQSVADLLTSADPSTDVKALFDITAKGHELRRVTLTGPFFQKGTDSTFTIVLDDYGKAVDIRAPRRSSTG